MDFSSKLLEDAVAEVAQLPGIGRRTALRLVLHLIKQPLGRTQLLSSKLLKLRQQLCFCKSCHNISDTELCHICANPNRNSDMLCVVEDIRDVMAIENTQQYKGKYHVLGGKISPVDGIGPDDLTIEALVSKVDRDSVEEIIFALSPTMEGDTTNFYIYKQISGYNLKVSTISRGVSVGGELEYVDEVTLGRSIMGRIPFEGTLKTF